MLSKQRIENLSNYFYLLSRFRNGWKLIKEARAGEICGEAVLWNGTRIVHPPTRGGLVGTILEIWKDRCYTSNDFYKPKNGDIVVDAGAHVGLFSLAVSKSAPASRVLCLEPFSENYECLLKNLDAARAKNVSVLNCALGAGNRFACMQAVGDRSIDHLLDYEPEDSERAVPVLSLRDILEHFDGQDVDMLKMDVEGAEYDAFEEADSNTLSRFRRIALEYHDNLRPGTLDLLTRRLEPTHEVTVYPTLSRGYGILLAKLRSPSVRLAS